MRKIVQVSVAGITNNSSTQANYVIVALCDDGTAWEMFDNRYTREWKRLPAIPQYPVMPLPQPRPSREEQEGGPQ